MPQELSAIFHGTPLSPVEIMTLCSVALILLIGFVMAIFRSDFAVLALIGSTALLALVVFTVWHALHTFAHVPQAPTWEGVAGIFAYLTVFAYAIETLFGLRELYRVIFRHGETFDE